VSVAGWRNDLEQCRNPVVGQLVTHDSSIAMWHYRPCRSQKPEDLGHPRVTEPRRHSQVGHTDRAAAGNTQEQGEAALIPKYIAPLRPGFYDRRARERANRVADTFALDNSRILTFGGYEMHYSKHAMP
jgi:hypothetical protein